MLNIENKVNFDKKVSDSNEPFYYMKGGANANDSKQFF